MKIDTGILKNPIVDTAVVCFILTLLGSQKNMGLLLPLLLLFLFPSLMKSCVICFTDRSKIKVKAIKAGIWAVGVVIIIFFQAKMHNEARQTANKIVVAIEKFKTEKGTYPGSLEDVKIPQEFISKSGIYYSPRTEMPYLVYPVTYMPFDTFDYDFQTRQWVHISS